MAIATSKERSTVYNGGVAASSKATPLFSAALSHKILLHTSGFGEFLARTIVQIFYNNK